MNSPDPRWLLAATGPPLDTRRARRRFRWLHHLHAPSPTAWAVVLASVAGIGLLTGFQQVVARSVLHGEQQRAAAEAHDMKLWRCNRLADAARRDQCLAQLRVAAIVVNPLEK